MLHKILVVGQDGDLPNHLRTGLPAAEFEVLTARGVAAGLKHAEVRKPSLILLDLTLPKTAGMDLCYLLKRGISTSHIPIIILASAATEEERISGFEAGADDYVTQPFSYREIILRIKKSISRHLKKELAPEVIVLGEIRLDPVRHEIAIRDRLLDLTHLEFKLMARLMEHYGQVLKRDELLDIVWGLNRNTLTRTIDSHITRLRRKLGVLAQYLETIRSVGFRLSEEIAYASGESNESKPVLHPLNFHFDRKSRGDLIRSSENKSVVDLAAA